MKCYNIPFQVNHITGVAISQWKQLCNIKRKETTEVVTKKIMRAASLGRVTHVYKNDVNKEETHVIVRFYDINLLIVSGSVYTVWRDNTRPVVNISIRERRKWDEKHGLSLKSRRVKHEK